MFGILTFSTLALAAVSSVSGAVVPRRNPPPGWLFNLLEPYQQYHTRYLALDCEHQHGTDFFTQCCHPMLATQQLSERPAQCTPSAPSMSSAAAAEPTSNVSTPVTPAPADDGDEDCDDGDDGDDPAPVTPAATSTWSSPASSATQASSSSSAASSTSSSSSSSSPSPTSVSDNVAAPPPPAAPSSSAAPPSSSAAPSSSSAAPAPAPSPSPSSSGDNSGAFAVGVPHTGGFGTFYTQDGVAGACGQVHQDSDLIVAMNAATFGGGSNGSPICGKQLKITNNSNGQSVVVTVADKCPGCRNDESIDMSTGAFNTIADPATGVIPITWEYIN